MTSLDSPGNNPGSINNKGKQGEFKESRVSPYHVHNDGTGGHDVDFVVHTYVDNEVVRTQQFDSDKKCKQHTVGDDSPKGNNDDSQAVKDYQEHESSDSGGSGGSSK